MDAHYFSFAASISLITAVEVINKSAINEMARSANLLNGYADINLVSQNGEFEEELFNKLVSVKDQLGIAAASPILSYQNWSDSLGKNFQVLGIDIFRAAGTLQFFSKEFRRLMIMISLRKTVIHLSICYQKIPQ